VDLYLRSNDATRAVTAAQDALTANRDRPELLDALGRAQIAAGAANQAVDTFAKWTQVQPKSPLAYLRLAESQIVNKDEVAAERSLRKALELKPDYLDAQRRLIALDTKNDRVPQALATAKKVQAQRPKESVGFLLEGDIHAAKKAWAPAIVAYRAGLAQADSADLVIRLHASLRANKQVAEADKLVAARLKSHPKETRFRNYLAEYAVTAREYPVAIQHYQALIAQQPNNPIWLNNLAWAASKTKDPKALEYAEQADRLRPNDPAIMDTLGVLLVEKGDTVRGVETLRKAVKLGPNRPDIRLNLAKSLIASGQKDAARKELDELAKVKFAGQQEAEKLLKELGS
jgi:putative PEP-CTERM system TPR-repeat lipoprotein